MAHLLREKLAAAVQQKACRPTKALPECNGSSGAIFDSSMRMLGLFGINMPLLYGEGSRAFYRLQLEILKESTDESIFAWTDPISLSGLFASSPRDFAEAGDMRLHNCGRRACLLRCPSDWF
jgi:hypothetical protein